MAITESSPMAKRKVSNPLALAVLSCLDQRPMHPYEMASTLRQRGQESAVKLNYGSLYSVVEALERAGFVLPQETTREGRRPERTVYALTEAGRAELMDWLRDLLASPTKEYSHFAAALTFMSGLPPKDAITLLRGRIEALDAQVRDLDLALSRGARSRDGAVPRLQLVEAEYQRAIKRAEQRWVAKLVEEIDDGSFAGIEEWAAMHRGPRRTSRRANGTRRIG